MASCPPADPGPGAADGRSTESPGPSPLGLSRSPGPTLTLAKTVLWAEGRPAREAGWHVPGGLGDPARAVSVPTRSAGSTKAFTALGLEPASLFSLIHQRSRHPSSEPIEIRGPRRTAGARPSPRPRPGARGSRSSGRRRRSPRRWPGPRSRRRRSARSSSTTKPAAAAPAPPEPGILVAPYLSGPAEPAGRSVQLEHVRVRRPSAGASTSCRTGPLKC